MDIYEAEAMDNETPTLVTFEEFEEMKKTYEYLIAQAQAAARLANNPDFENLIMIGYFTNEPQRLGSLMASNKLTPSSFDDCVHDLKSIGNLRKFLEDIIAKGNIAIQELENLEIARAQSIQETEGSDE